MQISMNAVTRIISLATEYAETSLVHTIAHALPDKGLSKTMHLRILATI
jgi:hypothetical protein